MYFHLPALKFLSYRHNQLHPGGVTEPAVRYPRQIVLSCCKIVAAWLTASGRDHPDRSGSYSARSERITVIMNWPPASKKAMPLGLAPYTANLPPSGRTASWETS